MWGEIIMKKINIEDAIGMELCHDVTEMKDGFKGAVFKRGHVIKEEDISTLLDIGKKHIFIMEAGTDELHEEDCAERLSCMCKTEGAYFTEVSEGKKVLVSDVNGMLRVDTELLQKINFVKDITITTLPDHYPVSKGMPVASMRIIPLMTKESLIIEAENLCKGKKLLQIKPYEKRQVGIIITGSEVYHGRIKDKFENIVRKKLATFPGEIVDVMICDDDVDMNVFEAKRLLDKGADMLVFSGGMSVDPDDVTPSAISTLGAEIVSYGVPSQPGNMTLVAYLGKVLCLGVPGAAITMPTTVFDVLLPAAFCGEKITKADLVKLGEGGLCQKCRECHFPNCTFGRY